MGFVELAGETAGVEVAVHTVGNVPDFDWSSGFAKVENLCSQRSLECSLDNLRRNGACWKKHKTQKRKNPEKSQNVGFLGEHEATF